MSTPKKNKTPPKDINAEFCDRVLALLASYYDTPSVEPFCDLPEGTDETNGLEFNSNVCDIRLKRILEAERKAEKEQPDLEQICKELGEAAVDLGNFFHEEFTEHIKMKFYNRDEEEEMEVPKKARTGSQYTEGVRRAREHEGGRAQPKVIKGQTPEKPLNKSPARSPRSTPRTPQRV